jgi:hypothetical protein
MKRFIRRDLEVWAGVHPKMGVLIYDPRAQVAVPDDKVRLYVCSERRTATFLKTIVRDRLAQGASASENVEMLQGAVEVYSALRGRFTHCYSCKRNLNSIEFQLCDACGWIRCECGACGCDYEAVDSADVE